MTSLRTILDIGCYFFTVTNDYFCCRIAGRRGRISRRVAVVAAESDSRKSRRPTRGYYVSARQQTVKAINPAIVGEPFARRNDSLPQVAALIAHPQDAHIGRHDRIIHCGSYFAGDNSAFDHDER